MTDNISRRSVCAAAIASAVPMLARAQAERFPSKPVRMIIPFSAGALIDILARIYGERLSNTLGQPFVVENRPGANGVPASQALLSVPPDGHTMLFISSAHSVAPLIQSNLPYDTLRDFSGLALLANSPALIVVHPDQSAKTLKQLIDKGRSKPEALSFGSAGVASSTHLAGEYLAQEAGLKFLHVPFKGVQEAIAEVAAGRLDVAFPPIGLAAPYLKSGRLRALGVTSPERASQIADVPTVVEGGIPNFDYSITYGVVMSSKTPKAHMNLLAERMAALTKSPEIQEKLITQGLIPRQLVLAEFDDYIARETAKLGKIVRAGNIKI
jgi:tripartite-type tricarboxylate transporter receptor subunit TctC